MEYFEYYEDAAGECSFSEELQPGQSEYTLYEDFFLNGIVEEYKWNTPVVPTGYFDELRTPMDELYEAAGEALAGLSATCRMRIAERNEEGEEFDARELDPRSVFGSILRVDEESEQYKTDEGRLAYRSVEAFLGEGSWQYSAGTPDGKSPVLWFGLPGADILPQWVLRPDGALTHFLFSDDDYTSWEYVVNGNNVNVSFFIWNIEEKAIGFPSKSEVIRKCPVALSRADTPQTLLEKLAKFFSGQRGETEGAAPDGNTEQDDSRGADHSPAASGDIRDAKGGSGGPEPVSGTTASVYIPMTDEALLRKLEHPETKVDAVLDTDCYNEIDDQFALSYLLQSPEKIRTRAVYAAPFLNEKAVSPADGCEKSYQEILHILALNRREDLRDVAFRGSERYLPDERTPVDSPAARDLVTRAMRYPEDRPLYVIAIGAITNVASAILMCPAIVNHIVVIWLGGHALFWPDNKEFNLNQDIAAARVIYGSRLPLIQLPCMGVVSAFTTTGPELEYHLGGGRNALCDYLVRHTEEEVKIFHGGPTWSRAIWDVTAVGWLTGDFEKDRIIPGSVPGYDGHWSAETSGHPVRSVYYIDRDGLFGDLFTKLQNAPG